jgi:hypothetical protein
MASAGGTAFDLIIVATSATQSETEARSTSARWFSPASLVFSTGERATIFRSHPAWCCAELLTTSQENVIPLACVEHPDDSCTTRLRAGGSSHGSLWLGKGLHSRAAYAKDSVAV